MRKWKRSLSLNLFFQLRSKGKECQVHIIFYFLFAFISLLQEKSSRQFGTIYLSTIRAWALTWGPSTYREGGITDYLLTRTGGSTAASVYQPLLSIWRIMIFIREKNYQMFTSTCFFFLTNFVSFSSCFRLQNSDAPIEEINNFIHRINCSK